MPPPIKYNIIYSLLPTKSPPTQPCGVLLVTPLVLGLTKSIEESMRHLNKKLVLACLWAGFLALNFWAGSRYPALDTKAAMAGSIPLSDTLSFESTLTYEADDPVAKRIAYATVNWIYTNKKGMTFGVLFGGAFLTQLSYLRRKRSRYSVANAAIGMMTGAPLGVCVNCVAPIAKGLHRAGASLETTLATMFSSPTLKMVVLSMLFSLFPGYLAALKIGLTLLLILVFVPFFSKTLFRKESDSTLNTVEIPVTPSPATWWLSFWEFCRDFLRNFLFIFKTTVPLMLVAGFLGVCLTQVIDLSTFTSAEPNIFLMSAAAIVGVFLPAPIALDLVLAQALLVAGLPVAYVMVFLFTLGIYSIYSCFIVWNTISRRVAISLYAIIVAMGVGGGYAAHYYNAWEANDGLDYFERRMRDVTVDVIPKAQAATSSKPADLWQTQGNLVKKQDGVRIYQSSYLRKETRGSGFSLVPGGQIGLDRPIKFSPNEFFTPFFNGRSISSGDFNLDGFDDIVVATRDGVTIFQNVKGQIFKTVARIEPPELRQSFTAAPVDIDNDGWLDLFVTTYGQGQNYWLKNRGGKILPEPIPLGDPTARLTKAVAFGDIDQNGLIDIVVGNWYMGFPTKRPPVSARNSILYNFGDSFRTASLSTVAGETLSALVSDYNMDGLPDVAIGNDFERPDVFYLGKGEGRLTRVARGGIIPHSTTSTMSMDTADINNDLRLDMYIAQITGSFQGGNVQEIEFSPDYCDGIGSSTERRTCLQNIKAKEILNYSSLRIADMRKCGTLDKAYENECMVQILMLMAIKDKEKSYCAKIPASYAMNRDLCESYFDAIPAPLKGEDKHVKQVTKNNVLLIGNRRGGFEDAAGDWGVKLSGWSWNAKFADLDNDEWQDLYVANGTWLNKNSHPNVFFHNQQGKRFKRAEKEFGLIDNRVVGSYTYFDFDNDGDLDIEVNAVNGTLSLYRNMQTSGQSIEILPRDHRGNSHCIGCKVFITYGNKKQQIREIKNGGGFHSHDSSLAHFGLGKHRGVKSIKIAWTDGETSRLSWPFSSGNRYIIVRDR